MTHEEQAAYLRLQGAVSRGVMTGINSLVVECALCKEFTTCTSDHKQKQKHTPDFPLSIVRAAMGKAKS